MKIYFCGSITGGRQDAGLYAELIKYLSKYGEILTEHIGNSNLSETGEMGKDNVTEESIYQKDVKMLTEADLVVAEITTPSLGVGYELGFAEALGKKVLCLYRIKEGRKASAMILGNKNFLCQEYAKLDGAYKIIDGFLA
jgi:nucleoside 2-deoxyribosyltransferase